MEKECKCDLSFRYWDRQGGGKCLKCGKIFKNQQNHETMETDSKKHVDNTAGCGCDCHYVHHPSGDSEHKSRHDELLSDCYCEGERYSSSAKCFVIGIVGCIIIIVILTLLA